MSDDLLSSLTELFPSSRVLSNAADRIHYGQDWTRWWQPDPLAVVFPETIDEVQALVCWAGENRVAIVPSGGRTGLSGGAVATQGEVVVSFERMHQIKSFNRLDQTLVVEPGVVTQAVQQKADEEGLFYPVDFASRGSSTIGGNIATNAGGIKVIRYGMTRDWVSGLKVVDGRGQLHAFNRGLIKNATGYDMRHIMIGSEGTLGLVVEATLQLTRKPANLQVMLLAVPDFESVTQLLMLMRERLPLTAFEFFTQQALGYVLANGARAPLSSSSPCYVLVEYEGDHQEQAAMNAFEEGMEQGWIEDGVMAQSEAQARALWHLREGITESIAARTPYKNDVSVKVSELSGFMADMEALFARHYPDYEVIWFGHIGDGNLHISVLKPEKESKAVFAESCSKVTDLLCDVLAKHHGSISAEHGVGLLKKPYLEHFRPAIEIELMQGIKRAFDPNGILNPGKLFDL